MQFILFTKYAFKQIIIHGRQFKFTEVKVIKLGVEHYNYNTSCGNNNVQHTDSDHACLPSRVLKMKGADLNSIILWLWLGGGGDGGGVIFIMIFNIFVIINSFTLKLTVQLFLS